MIKQTSILHMLIGFLVMATAYLMFHIGFPYWCVIATASTALMLFFFAWLTWRCNDWEKVSIISLLVSATLLIPPATITFYLVQEAIWCGVVFLVVSAATWILAYYEWINYKKKGGDR